MERNPEMQKVKPEITVCTGSSCFARGNKENLGLIEKYLELHNLKDEVDLVLNCCLCRNRCNNGPNITISGKEYSKVDKGMMLEILKDTFDQ